MRTFLHTAREWMQTAWGNARTVSAASWPVIRPLWPAFRVVIAIMAVEIILDNIYPLLYGRMTDTVVAHNGRGAIIMIGMLTMLGLTSRLITFARERYEVEHIDWEVNLRIMNEALNRITGFSMAQSAEVHSGKTRDIVSKGRNAMNQLVFMVIYRLGPILLDLAISLVAVAYFSTLVGGLTAIAVVVYLGIAVKIFLSHRKPLEEIEERGNENSRLFADNLSNMELIMASARQQKTVNEFIDDGRDMAHQGKQFWRKALGVYYTRNGVVFIFRSAATALIAYQFFQGRFSFGMFVALSQWVNSALMSMQQLGHMQREFSGCWAKIDVYLKLLQQPPEIVVSAEAICPVRLQGKVEFKDVVFEYTPRKKEKEDEKPSDPAIALKGVSFTIPPGQKVAIIGESGAGKSTIAYALMRAREVQGGAILVDDLDLRSLNLDAFRLRIGYVPQRPQLFDLTLRYNLAFGLNGHAQDVTDEELMRALATVKLDHIANNGGLDKKLGENGHTLSGGERQRLCIARALLKDPDVLIFDEATSSLDPVNEKKVQDTIDTARARTKIIIAHRYSTIKDVDRILVFEQGKLVEDGTHHELQDRSPYYRALLEQQGLL